MSSNWKILASQEAQIQGVESDIVFATIDAETGGNNILGDSGNALGFGQVWPSLHYDAFQYAANRLKIMGLPSQSDLSGLQSFTIQNDQFSMIMTVYCIKQFWINSGKNWSNFTYSYVGAGIPNSDYNRRYTIWQQYQGKSSSDVTSGLTDTGDQSNSGVLDIPATNFNVLGAGNQPSEILFGRRYRVIVSDKTGNKALDVSDLKCVFDIQKTMQMQANYSIVTIYNLSAQTENTLINEGNRVVIEAGYEGEQYGCIYDGTVVQPLRDKQDGVNYLLTLNCLDGDGFLNGGVVNFSISKGQTHVDVSKALLSKATISTTFNAMSQSLGNTSLIRGKVCFGLSKDYLRQIAISNNASIYLEDGKVNIIQAKDLPKDEIINLDPTSGLLGVPAQTEYGVSFKCMLNARIKINSLVHINNTLVHDMQSQIGQVVRPLDNDGIYRIIKINHVGDTRGDDWYTACESVSQAGLLPSMVTSSGGSFT